ncbi:glycosyl hydrolase [Nocardioides acrostichi]|uniref:Asl1-like glycosyl hydrolase catalytic domain-containing protein n=1 Tax=Nocardioides acrostichi TaxID=2784339 RepID=A0A930UY49_9ACTN|nr:glycosyl hydrolase [Nocardioides acrostichi]MBF4160247.1 hypothetical protein [Nocardioides acrostichi]
MPLAGAQGSPAAAGARRDSAGAAARPPGTGAGAGAGVGVWQERGVTQALRRSHATWYHAWTAEPPGYIGTTKARFVPMMWGAGSLTDDELAAAAEHGPWLLGFNEPDLASQSNLSVGEALDLWPRLESTGLRLVSPAVAYGGADPDGWLDRFMQGAADRGLEVDAVALHWYGGDWHPRAAVRQLTGYLDAVHERYGKPVWLTEFALMRFGVDPSVPAARTQARFLRLAAEALAERRWVRRWAWFGLPAAATGRSSGLYRPGAEVTRVGRAFAGLPALAAAADARSDP